MFRRKPDTDLKYLLQLIIGSYDDYVRFRDMIRKMVGVPLHSNDPWHKIIDDVDMIVWKRGLKDVQIFATVRADMKTWDINLVLNNKVVGKIVVCGKRVAISRIAAVKDEIDAILRAVGK